MTAAPVATHLAVDTARYLGGTAPRRLRDRLDIAVAPRAYEPQPDDPQRDWVASIGVPALRVLLARRGEAACRRFCAVGTGAGLDALAAVEILGATTIGLTDLFEEVVATAAANVRGNLRPGVEVAVLAGAGDLLQPLRGQGVRFDVIYENLPNLPLAEGRRLEESRTSAAFVPPRAEPVPAPVATWLLVLHHLLLEQAREALAPGGTVIATLGARVPLPVIAEMAEGAGYAASFLTYGWKVQGDPEDVIGTYAAWERRGLGPFGFYPASLLEATFAGLDPAQAGQDALAIEHDLAPRRLDARAAWDAHGRGERIGHTVAVLRADLR